MKKILVAAAVCFLAVRVRASDFGIISLTAPRVMAGTFISASGGGSSSGGAVEIITHKAIPSNNIVSSIISGWIPVDLGGTIGGSLGKASLDGGTCVNLLPAAKATLYGLVDSLAPDGAVGLKATLTANANSDSSLFFFGPQFSWQLQSLAKSKTDLVWFGGVHLPIGGK